MDGMTMPRNLVYVRHGQSVRNYAGKIAYETGDMALFEEVINKPSSVAPLTKLGCDQAIKTGQWLRAQGFKFRRRYTSSFNRAKETAALLGLDDHWYIDNNIRERSGGVMEDMTPPQRQAYLEGIRNQGHVFDPFNFRPDRGESYADVDMRKTFFFGTLHRECNEDDVLCVNHGDNMWVVDYKIRRWTTEQFVAKRGNGHGKIPNCMVVHYTRIDPDNPDGEPSKHLDWVRMCCPWEDPIPGAWERIERPRFSSEDLLAQVAASMEHCQVRRVS
jgi:broad specificity phosphatase PhoE